MYNVSSAFLTKIKESSRTIKSSLGIGDKALTNLLANSDFVGTTGWGVEYSTLSAVNNILSVTGLGTNPYIGASRSTGTAVAIGDKIYMRSTVRVTNSVATYITLRVHDGTGSTLGITQQNTPSANTWYKLSGIIPMDNAGTLSGIVRCSYADNATALGKVMEVQPIVLLNLTAIYGAGNEPTQAYMDELMDKVGWFSGTKNTPLYWLDDSTVSEFSIDYSLGNGNLPSIGSTVSNKLSVTLVNSASIPQTLIGVPIRPYVAVAISTGVYEWVRLGEFYVDYDGVEKGKLSTHLEGFDIMADYTSVAYVANPALTMTVQGVLNDLATQGVVFSSQPTLPLSTPIKSVPVGSIRQVLSEMASLMSTNATIDYDGKVKFVFTTIVPQGTFELGLDNYSDFKLLPDSQVKFSGLTVTDGTNEIPWGDSSGYALSFHNSQVTNQAEVQAVYERIFPMYYYAYTLKAQGMPHLQLGDIITFTYVKLDGSTATIQIPLLQHKLRFGGGLTSEFNATAPQQQTTDITVTSGSTVTDAIDITYKDFNQSLEMATKQITGNKGGYVTTILNEENQPQEIVISSTPDYNTAEKVWRWNASGLGFSSDGFNGVMDIALTADGKINASMMTTGVLDAGRIKAGLIQDVQGQSFINMADGTFNFGNGRIVWDGTSFDINFADTNIATALGEKLEATTFAPYASNISFNNGIITLGKTENPFSVNITNQAVEFIDKGTTGGTVNLTAISGNGSQVTCTFAQQAVIPYQVDGYAEVAGCSVTAYNGTWKIIDCTKTQVVLECTATGTVASGFGTVGYGSSPNTVAYINGKKMYITELQTTSMMQVGNHQIYKYNDDITLIKFAG